jgi:hypothetical protein
MIRATLRGDELRITLMSGAGDEIKVRVHRRNLAKLFEQYSKCSASTTIDGNA